MGEWRRNLEKKIEIASALATLSLAVMIMAAKKTHPYHVAMKVHFSCTSASQAPLSCQFHMYITLARIAVSAACPMRSLPHGTFQLFCWSNSNVNGVTSMAALQSTHYFRCYRFLTVIQPCAEFHLPSFTQKSSRPSWVLEMREKVKLPVKLKVPVEHELKLYDGKSD